MLLLLLLLLLLPLLLLLLLLLRGLAGGSSRNRCTSLQLRGSGTGGRLPAAVAAAASCEPAVASISRAAAAAAAGADSQPATHEQLRLLILLLDVLPKEEVCEVASDRTRWLLRAAAVPTVGAAGWRERLLLLLLHLHLQLLSHQYYLQLFPRQLLLLLLLRRLLFLMLLLLLLLRLLCRDLRQHNVASCRICASRTRLLGTRTICLIRRCYLISSASRGLLRPLALDLVRVGVGLLLGGSRMLLLLLLHAALLLLVLLLGFGGWRGRLRRLQLLPGTGSKQCSHGQGA